MRCASAPRAGLIAWRVEHRSRGRIRSVANHRGLGQVDDASRRPTRRAFEVQSSAAVGALRRAGTRARRIARIVWRRARVRPRPIASRRAMRPRASSSDDREPSTSASSVSEAEESSSNEEKSLDARIWALALPAVAALLLDPVLGAVDTAFVGRLEGERRRRARRPRRVHHRVQLFVQALQLPRMSSAAGGVADRRRRREARVHVEASDGAETATTTSEMEIGAGRAAAAETVRGAMTLAVALGISATLALEIGAGRCWRGAGGNGSRDVLVTNERTNEGSGPTMRGEAEERTCACARVGAPALVGTVAVGAFPRFAGYQDAAVGLRRREPGEPRAGPHLDLRVRARSRVRGGGRGRGDHRRGVDRRSRLLGAAGPRGAPAARSRRRKTTGEGKTATDGVRLGRRDSEVAEVSSHAAPTPPSGVRGWAAAIKLWRRGRRLSWRGRSCSKPCWCAPPPRRRAPARRRAPDLHTGLVGHALRAGRARGARAVGRRQPGRGGRARRAARRGQKLWSCQRRSPRA